MPGEIDFYYEFSSPYGYVAAELIEDIAAKHNYGVNWKPFLLGAVFKAEGTQSLVDYPMKGPYSRHDIERSARYYNLAYQWPPRFPIFSVNAARAIYWVKDIAPSKDKELSIAIYRAAFADGRDIADIDVLADVAISVGLDSDAMLAGIKSSAIKQMLKEEVQVAMDRKVFGSPFFIIGGEPFWGVDRLPQLEKWLETGGW